MSVSFSTPKIPNVIEPIENIFISPKEKDPLKYQIVDKWKKF